MSLLLTGAGVAPGGASPYGPYTTAFYAQVLTSGGSLTMHELTALNNFETSNTTNLAQMDRLWIFGLSDQIAAGISFVNPASTQITQVNAPAWAANFGYTGDGVSAYLNSNYNPTVNGLRYISTSAGYFYYNRTNTMADYADLGTVEAATKTFIFPRSSTNDIIYPINYDTAFGSPVVANPGSDARGLWQNYRQNNNSNIYQNATLIATDIKAPAAVPNINFWILGIDNSGLLLLPSTNQLSLVGFSSGNINPTTNNAAVQTLATDLGFHI